MGDALSEQSDTEVAKEDTHQYQHNKASMQEVELMMKTMDVDGDRMVSWLELLTFFNREGSQEGISPQELEAGGFGPMADAEKKELKDLFDMTDADNDGKISQKELAKFLSTQEADAARAAATAAAEGEPASDGIDGDDQVESLLEGSKFGQKRSPEAAVRKKEILAAFTEADTNKDGHLGLGEILALIGEDEAREHRELGMPGSPDDSWREDATKKFKVADKDSDGKLSHHEFEALVEEWYSS